MNPDKKVRASALVGRIASKHGAEGLATCVLMLEALSVRPGRGTAEDAMSMFLSNVATSMPWMLDFAESLAVGYVDIIHSGVTP